MNIISMSETHKAETPGILTLETKEDLSKIQTLTWLRLHLTGPVEILVRSHAQTNNDVVTAFMSMVDARVNDYLITADNDYKLGVTALFDAGLLTEPHKTELLALGGHE